VIHRFGDFSLGTETCELRCKGALVPVEPQVLALLRLLIDNRQRLVGKDEIIQHVWKGRIVSEAAISSRVKSARRAIGDDGASQRLIRTYPRLGFRFVAEAQTEAAAGGADAAPPAGRLGPAGVADRGDERPVAPRARPSIAVLPFVALGAAQPWIADALPHDLISALSRLRWLFVIARGSSFRLRGADATVERARQLLNVGYVLSGAVEVDGGAIVVTVELCDTRDGGVVWSERRRGPVGSVHEIREQIAQAVVSALELQIPVKEAHAARLGAPASLDAWSAYHLGLSHLYRFDREGSARAAALFERAIEVEPGFARAHAGLSFAHFENAFLGFAADPDEAASQARRFAENSLERDPLDPFCNMVMGRAHWLRGDLEASLPWLERSVQLNPNNAQAKYSRGWTEALLGQGLEAQANVDAALQLSPLDPLAYGMLGARAFSHMVLDQAPEAANWGERAARAPGAHALIEMIAAVGHTLNGDEARGRSWARSAGHRSPGLAGDDFLKAFPFRPSPARERICAALDTLGA
jgi:TolB-like protein/DNA-binding winged helix-turn-helix (wHTH) protein